MDDSDGFEVAGDQAWSAFRGRLADRIATLTDDDLLHIDAGVGVDEDELDGANPYLQLVGWGGDLVRAEAAGNAFLAPTHRLDAAAVALLHEIGWEEPTYVPPAEPDAGSANHWIDVERREADLLAVLCVRALREVYGCPHPSFLDADGLQLEPVTVQATEAVTLEHPEEPIAVFPETSEELSELVDAALALMLDEPLRHDADGDLPVVVGKSVVLVRIADDVPAVDLICELVLDVAHRDRADVEVGILNRDHPSLQFHVHEDRIIARYRLCAVPFAPAQLRAVLAAFCEGLDETAADLTRRVGGRRLLEDPAGGPERSAPEGVDPDRDEHPALAVLRELAVTGPVSAEMAATVCGMDRELIAGQIMRLRGAPDDDVTAPLVAALGEALRLVVERQTAQELGRPKRRTAGRQSVAQPSLFPELEPGQETLDLG
ncbi:T3SS (YopN, CesT) and YbjN peptide-binding chaperone 1 [Nocardioides pacificus]